MPERLRRRQDTLDSEADRRAYATEYPRPGRMAKASGFALGAQAKLVASDVTVVVLEDTGHRILEERPKDTIVALTGFLQ